MRQFLTTLFLSAPLLVSAQLKLITKIQSAPVRVATTDRAGDLYVLTDQGIQKFDRNGKAINKYEASAITAFDPGNGVRMLAYKRDSSQYAILSPSLQPVESGTVDPSFAIEPFLVCSSGDYNMWILDAADWSLKNIDWRESKILSDVKIDTIRSKPEFSFMREYQNLLFLLNQDDGILIFNTLGKYVKKIPVTNVPYFNFLGEEMYYYRNGNINFIDLFSGDERSYSFNQTSPSYVVLTDSRLFAVDQTSISIFEFSPEKDLQNKD